MIISALAAAANVTTRGAARGGRAAGRAGVTVAVNASRRGLTQAGASGALAELAFSYIMMMTGIVG